MCRNIQPLFNFEPPATAEEVSQAALQFVRKLSGSPKPSKANQAAFDQAVAEVSQAVQRMLDGMTTDAPPHNRETERAKLRARSAQRFAPKSERVP